MFCAPGNIRSAQLFGCLTVKMFLAHHRISFGWKNRDVPVFGWRIESIEFQFLGVYSGFQLSEKT